MQDQLLYKANIGDVLKLIRKQAPNPETNHFYAILTGKDKETIEIDDGETRFRYFLKELTRFFREIHFIRSNQFLLKTTDQEDVKLFLVDEFDNIINYQAKVSIKNPYY